MQFPKGSMLVFDRGYKDYDWFLSLTGKNVNFVTRLKDNASWVVVETRPLAAGSNRFPANLDSNEVLYNILFTATRTSLFYCVPWPDSSADSSADSSSGNSIKPN